MHRQLFIILTVFLFLEVSKAASLAKRDELGTPVKRSDDPVPLEAVVQMLTQRLAVLEAKEAASQNQLTSLQQRVAVQERKQCLSGDVSFTPHDEPEVHFPSSGSVQRTESHHVTFSTPFDTVPAVTLGFIYLDADESHNLRVNTQFQNLNVNGFDLSVREWEQSQNHYVTVRWMACP